MHTELFPKAGVLDTDCGLLKEASCDHAAYRQHSGEGAITWQARMQKSGISCFQLVEELRAKKRFKILIVYPECPIFHVFNFERLGLSHRTWSTENISTMV